MKKYLFGLSAVLIALTCFAFSPKKIVGCDETLYYFEVTASPSITCSNITIDDLAIEDIVDSDNDNTPDELQAAGFLLNASAQPFGCASQTQTFACAVGYRANQLVEQPGTGKWVPASPASPVCCLRKAE